MSHRESPRRQARETAAIMLSALAILTILHFAGKERIRYAPAPVVSSVSDSHESFPLWHDQKVFGRTLVLFARYLRVHVQEDDTAAFTADEFKDTGRLEDFCSVLRHNGIIAPGDPCSLETLEWLLRSFDLHERLSRSHSLRLSGPVSRLLRMSQGYFPDYDRMSPAERRRLRDLNRSLLELAYPGICPVHLPYGLTPDNYVFLGIKHRIIRRVFHVLPEAAWAEASGNLDRFPEAVRQGTGYRVTVHEGVPVVAVRLQDLPKISETVIAHINTDVWQPGEIGAIADLLHRGRVNADITTASGTLAAGLLKEIPDGK